MALQRERPKKIPDVELLKIVARNTDEVTVGPSLAEISAAAGLAHGPTQRRVKAAIREGLLEPAYRGYQLTEKAADLLGVKE